MIVPGGCASPSFVHQLRLETESRLVELTVARLDQTKTPVLGDEGMSERRKKKKVCVSLFSAHLQYVACRLA